jgi:hypothetical protein
MPRLQDEVPRMGLWCRLAPFHLVVARRHPLGDEFVRTASGPAPEGCRGVLYLVAHDNEDVAERLVEIESTRPGDPDVGRLLGYPPCCVAAYRDIAAGRDWVQSMLERTPEGTQAYTACNRVARLFGPWLVLPDYFPCSFACRATAAWATQVEAAARSSGLAAFVDASQRALADPVLVEPHRIRRLCDPSKSVEHATGLLRARLLTWRASVEAER